MEGGAQRRHTKRSCDSRMHADARGARPSIGATLTGKITSLPGFEAVTKVALPPLIGLIEMSDLHFVGSRMLRKPVAKCEVAVETHELAKINIGNARVAANDEHVLVVIRGGGFTKVCRTGNNQRIGA